MPIHATSVTIGPDLGTALDVARDARLPVLLLGKHGIGKSEFLEAYARDRDIEPYVLDLSLLEATDLTGLPYLDAATTRFAPPATLPPSATERPTLLVLEELNRCDRSVRQPCLQLLTARRLNDYRLPDGCFLVACVNPVEDGYDVDELDVALASRFVSLRVEPDRARWASWARASRLDPRVVTFVERYPQAFQAASPRSWTHAARLVGSVERLGATSADRARALAAVLPSMAAHALARALQSDTFDLPAPSDVAAHPTRHVELFRRLAAEKRLDALKVLLDGLDEHLDSGEGAEILYSGLAREQLAALVREAPPDLRAEVERHFPKEAGQS